MSRLLAAAFKQSARHFGLAQFRLISEADSILTLLRAWPGLARLCRSGLRLLAC